MVLWCGVVDADGAFFTKLSLLYEDDNWQIVDLDTGDIRYTASLEACDAADRPNVAEEYQNNCVQCMIEYIDDDLTVTYSIPVEPVAAASTTDIRRTSAGVAFNGIRIAVILFASPNANNFRKVAVERQRGEPPTCEQI